LHLLESYGSEKMKTVVLITGGTKGVGKWIAEDFAKSLSEVVLVLNYKSDYGTALQTEEELRQMSNAEIMLYKADIRNEDEVEKMVDVIIKTYGKIDVLINNAGVNKDAVTWKMEKKDWDEVINTNLTGAFLCTKHVLPHMRQACFGRIINISSVVGQMGVFGTCAYSATKAGLIGFTKTVAKEVANKNITVNCIALGYVQTGMSMRIDEELRKAYEKNIPLGRFATKDEVTGIVLFLCSKEASYITGQVINVNGGCYM